MDALFCAVPQKKRNTRHKIGENGASGTKNPKWSKRHKKILNGASGTKKLFI
jgi:hypothetical protein